MPTTWLPTSYRSPIMYCYDLEWSAPTHFKALIQLDCHVN